jgi:outer membrane protein assembly factor BamB
MVGMNPQNGTPRWEAVLASSRGTNEVERLVDLVSGYSREGSQICARAFQYAVGCVDAGTGKLIWTKAANGSSGVAGDAVSVFGPEEDGKLVAWSRTNGERLWVSERLRFRSLTTPLSLGRSMVVGDDAGNVHFLSKEDGSPLNRLPTDESGISVAPVLAGQTLVVVTRKGSVRGFRPD